MKEYHIRHYMPELGSPTAGSGETRGDEQGALASVRHSLETAKVGHRIVVEVMDFDNDVCWD